MHHKRLTAHQHCRFPENAPWLRRTRHLSLFIFITQITRTLKTESESWGCDQKERALSHFYFVPALRWFPALTPSDGFERPWLRANSEKDKCFIRIDISAEVMCWARGYQEESKVNQQVPCVLCPYRVVLFQVFCCILLCIASDFSDDDDALRLGILQEHLQTVYEVCSVEWIAANTLQETKQTRVVESSLLEGNSCAYLSKTWLQSLREGKSAAGTKNDVDMVWNSALRLFSGSLVSGWSEFHISPFIPFYWQVQAFLSKCPHHQHEQLPGDLLLFSF